MLTAFIDELFFFSSSYGLLKEGSLAKQRKKIFPITVINLLLEALPFASSRSRATYETSRDLKAICAKLFYFLETVSVAFICAPPSDDSFILGRDGEV